MAVVIVRVHGQIANRLGRHGAGYKCNRQQEREMAFSDTGHIATKDSGSQI
jgi:hypothetical protein